LSATDFLGAAWRCDASRRSSVRMLQDVYLHFGLHPSRARALLRQSSDRVPAARLRRRV